MAWFGVIAAVLCATTAVQPGLDLVRNGSFEEGAMTGLPGWEAFGGGAVVDEAVSHTGGRSIRVSGPGGMRTELVPYAGGRVSVVGWMKTKDVVAGPSASWHEAALQVISYDTQKHEVGHLDVALEDGTRDWTRYESEFLLSREIAYVSVWCHLWGDDAKGTAWFDDVSMRFLDDPKVIKRKPMDLSGATVTVDFGHDLGELRHLWIGSDVGYSDRVVSSTQINAMVEARRFGFRYVRLHDCVHNPAICSEDARGRAFYSWDGFDGRINAVVEHGMWPVVVLETMPPEIATGNDGLNWTNPYPAKGRRGYERWQELNRQIVLHCMRTWGDDVLNWYFEVWNEPDASLYSRGTLEDYLRVYDHAVAGATAAEPRIRIGGPGGGGTHWLRPFLEHCRDGRNDATRGRGCRVDFLSYHIYTVGVGIPAFDTIPLSIHEAREARDAVPGYRNLPTLITEWGCASSNSAVHDRPYDAAFRAMAVRYFLDGGVTLALPFCLGEGPPHAHEGFMGGLALYTKSTIPKPSARAFELLDRMVGRRVACESTNDPVDGLACLSRDGRKAQVLLWNLTESPDRPEYETWVTVRLAGLPEAKWSGRATRIAPGECDPFLTWQTMGSPEKLSEEQHAALLAASQLPAPEAVEVSAGRIHARLPGFSLTLLELERRD